MRLEALQEFHALTKGQALILATGLTTMTELILYNDEATAEDYEILKEGIGLLLNEPILDYKVINLGDKYCNIDGTIRLKSDIKFHKAG